MLIDSDSYWPRGFALIFLLLFSMLRRSQAARLGNLASSTDIPGFSVKLCLGRLRTEPKSMYSRMSPLTGFRSSSLRASDRELEAESFLEALRSTLSWISSMRSEFWRAVFFCLESLLGLLVRRGYGSKKGKRFGLVSGIWKRRMTSEYLARDSSLNPGKR